MNIAMIAAIGKNNELGKNGDLIWHFKEDMAFFKAKTTGATVIMGRKTFESLPKALPNRKNIVITNNAHYLAPGAQTATSVQNALAMCRDENVFIIGGAKIYELFLPHAKTLYLTEIQAECPDADTYFPAFDKSQYTRESLGSSECNGIQFEFVKYCKC